MSDINNNQVSYTIMDSLKIRSNGTDLYLIPAEAG